MTNEEIMQAIEEKREEARRLSREVWGAPHHIAVEIEPRITVLNQEIDALKVTLYKQAGGTIERSGTAEDR